MDNQDDDATGFKGLTTDTVFVPASRKSMDWFFKEPEEHRVRVQTVQVDWICPECKMGHMVYTNSMWPTSDPGYHHKCSSCGFLAAIHGHRYPEIRHEEIDD